MNFMKKLDPEVSLVCSSFGPWYVLFWVGCDYHVDGNTPKQGMVLRHSWGRCEVGFRHSWRGPAVDGRWTAGADLEGPTAAISALVGLTGVKTNMKTFKFFFRSTAYIFFDPIGMYLQSVYYKHDFEKGLPPWFNSPYISIVVYWKGNWALWSLW